MNNQRKTKIFDDLVKNAIDFLQHSLSEIETNPKYSLINFCAAIELFFKARLMWEHWSLVDETPSRATVGGFLSGEFKSVGMEEAILRLEKIAEVAFTEAEKGCFHKLRLHRNKLIHLYHPMSLAPVKKGTIESVVSEQFEAWFYLHRMLTDKWVDQFSAYQSEIAELHSSVKSHAKFLQVRFDAYKSDIEKGLARGRIFALCSFCGFKSCILKDTDIQGLYAGNCRVCENSTLKLRISCPICSTDIFVGEQGQGRCTKCELETTLGMVLANSSPIQELNGEQPSTMAAYCSECRHIEQPTIFPVDAKKWLCVNCFHRWEGHELGNCGWCGDFVAGKVGDYWSPGCIRCGWHIEAEVQEMKRYQMEDESQTL